jgi:hypothetical protein
MSCQVTTQGLWRSLIEQNPHGVPEPCNTQSGWDVVVSGAQRTEASGYSRAGYNDSTTTAPLPLVAGTSRQGWWTSFRPLATCLGGFTSATAVTTAHTGVSRIDIPPVAEHGDVLLDGLDDGGRLDARPRDNPTARSRVFAISAQRLLGSVPRARPPDYDDSSARRDHQASAALIARSASSTPSRSPAVAAQCKGIRARAPGSQRRSSRVSGSGAVPS